MCPSPGLHWESELQVIQSWPSYVLAIQAHHVGSSWLQADQQ